MKTQSKLLIIALFIALGTSAYGAAHQVSIPPVPIDTYVPTVKILPAKAGILKVLYVNDQKETVTVKILNDNRIIFSDKVKVLPEEKGFLKFYDIDNLTSGEYWVEVAGNGIVTKFQIVHRQNKAVWAKCWDSFLKPETPVASKQF